jgi:thiamine pyrophosphate-dependent acetolactate synthase large subunit-like protein
MPCIKQVLSTSVYVLIADLVFVIGTSLIVQPFSLLPGYTYPKVPRILLNNDPVETFDRPNDAFIQGDCDESIWKLCLKLGWQDELRELHKKIDGVSREWDMEFRKKSDESTDNSDKTVVEDTVAQLTKELEEELKLDKEEDVEVGKVEDKAEEPVEDSKDSDTEAKQGKL